MPVKKADYYQVAQGVWGMKVWCVNVYMIANRKGVGDGWVLIDTGIKGSAKKIVNMAQSIFGDDAKPAAIILTHGHFDHSGSLLELLKYWDVPVYAHPLELPYLTGKSNYPPGDSTVGGGLMSWLAFTYPVKPINLGNKVQPLDISGNILELPEWKTVHTPGHSPGHIALYFKLNATLIAGDALATTKTESLIYALTFAQRLSGPPQYFTSDWAQAAESVRKLYALEPRVVSAGHGYPIRGKDLVGQFSQLVDSFEDDAIPGYGRYVQVPAEADENGLAYTPPAVPITKTNLVIITFTSIAIGFFVMQRLNKNFGNNIFRKTFTR